MKNRIFLILFLLTSQSAWTAPRGSVDLRERQVFVTRTTKLYNELSQFKRATAILKPGLKIQLLQASSRSNWIKIKSPSGRSGWIKKNHSSLSGRRAEPLIKDPKHPGYQAPNTVSLRTKDFRNKFYMSPALAYSNRITLNQAHGLGGEIAFAYFVSQNFALGVFGSWYLHQVNKLNSGNISVKRKDSNIRVGALSRFQFEQFAVDLSPAYALNTSKYSATNSSGAASALPAGCQQSKREDRRLSLGVAPSFRIPMSDNTVFELFAQWSVDFYKLQSADCSLDPTSSQSLSAGIKLQLLL